MCVKSIETNQRRKRRCQWGWLPAMGWVYSSEILVSQIARSIGVLSGFGRKGLEPLRETNAALSRANEGGSVANPWLQKKASSSLLRGGVRVWKLLQQLGVPFLPWWRTPADWSLHVPLGRSFRGIRGTSVFRRKRIKWYVIWLNSFAHTAKRPWRQKTRVAASSKTREHLCRFSLSLYLTFRSFEGRS